MQLQVLGMTVVVFTALGCLYFMDSNNVASQAGLQAVGALLLILNIAYVIWMGLLISRTGLPKAKRVAYRTVTMSRTGSMQAKSAVVRSLRTCSPRAWRAWLVRRNTSDFSDVQQPRNGDLGRGISMQISLLDVATRPPLLASSCPGAHEGS